MVIKAKKKKKTPAKSFKFHRGNSCSISFKSNPTISIWKFPNPRVSFSQLGYLQHWKKKFQTNLQLRLFRSFTQRLTPRSESAVRTQCLNRSLTQAEFALRNVPVFNVWVQHKGRDIHLSCRSAAKNSTAGLWLDRRAITALPESPPPRQLLPFRGGQSPPQKPLWLPVHVSTGRPFCRFMSVFLADEWVSATAARYFINRARMGSFKAAPCH